MEIYNFFKAIIELLKQILELLKNAKNQDCTFTQSLHNDELLTRQQVKDYLGISESTYIRKVKMGQLKPLKMPGGDRFYKSELIKAYNESIRRGRI